MEGLPGTSKVRVLTLNLWGKQGAWNERRSVLVDGLRELSPDLIAPQEALVGDGYDQVVDLLGPGFHVVHQSVGLLGDALYGPSPEVSGCALAYALFTHLPRGGCSRKSICRIVHKASPFVGGPAPGAILRGSS